MHPPRAHTHKHTHTRALGQTDPWLLAGRAARGALPLFQPLRQCSSAGQPLLLRTGYPAGRAGRGGAQAALPDRRRAGGAACSHALAMPQTSGAGPRPSRAERCRAEPAGQPLSRDDPALPELVPLLFIRGGRARHGGHGTAVQVLLSESIPCEKHSELPVPGGLGGKSCRMRHQPLAVKSTRLTAYLARSPLTQRALFTSLRTPSALREGHAGSRLRGRGDRHEGSRARGYRSAPYRTAVAHRA